ncbi:MAG: leucine-rich repeat domain-containing protein, partial [Candidatus Limivicinus sp.]
MKNEKKSLVLWRGSLCFLLLVLVFALLGTCAFADSQFTVDRAGTLTGFKGTDRDIVIPDNVKVIGPGAFSGKQGISSVTIPEGVTKIDTKAFYGCTGLRRVDFPTTLTEIGYQAFFNNDALSDLDLPNGL